MVNNWLGVFPRFSTATHSSGEYYRLSGDIALRSTKNALKLRDSIQLHCEGNPFIMKTPLKSIVSSVLIPEAAKEDIFCRVIKLREERQLLARFLVIQQSRPELVPRLAATIGDYEMAVTPRSMFASDGSLLIPTDKASIIHAIEAAKPIQREAETSPQGPVLEPLQASTQTSVQEPAPDVTLDNLLYILTNDSVEGHDRVIIIDCMAVVQSMTKSADMKTIVNFKEAFLKRITRMLTP